MAGKLTNRHQHTDDLVSQGQGREPIAILGVPVHNLTYEEAFDRLEAMIATKRPHQIVTVNPEFLVIAQGNAEFYTVLRDADLALADGVGLQLAAILQGRRFVSRVPGSELVYRMAPIAAARGWRLFFLGAGPGIAARAARTLQTRYPNLQIEVDDADPTPAGMSAAIAHIRAVCPDILLVAYGAPTQDLWIAHHGSAIGVPVMIGIGGTLDFLASATRRPPPIWHRLGLEWFYRLLQEPWRWRRQLRLPLFVLMVLYERLRAIRLDPRRWPRT